MATKEKIESVAYIKERLEKNNNFILASYSGLTVEQMQNLRSQFRNAGNEMKVIKNNLFQRALNESSAHSAKKIDLGSDFNGPLVAIFAGDDLPGMAKICKDYSKSNEALKVKVGYFSGEVLNSKGIEQIAGLPSRDELLAQVARGINAPATSIASGINQIMASLARAINKVAEKNGK